MIWHYGVILMPLFVSIVLVLVLVLEARVYMYCTLNIPAHGLPRSASTVKYFVLCVGVVLLGVDFVNVIADMSRSARITHCNPNSYNPVSFTLPHTSSEWSSDLNRFGKHVYFERANYFFCTPYFACA